MHFNFHHRLHPFTDKGACNVISYSTFSITMALAPPPPSQIPAAPYFALLALSTLMSVTMIRAPLQPKGTTKRYRATMYIYFGGIEFHPLTVFNAHNSKSFIEFRISKIPPFLIRPWQQLQVLPGKVLW